MISLNDSVSKLHLVKPQHEKALAKLGIHTVKDLLYHFPRDWQDLTEIKTISEIRPGERINIRARVKQVANPGFPFRRPKITEALLEDKTGNLIAVWFNQPYIKNSLRPGSEYFFSGKTQLYSSKRQTTLQLTHPMFELVKEDTIHVAGIIPVYQLTEGVTEKQLRYWMKQALPALSQTSDVIPKNIAARLKLLDQNTAIRNIHFPDSQTVLEKARKRLAFEELFLFQLAFQGYKKTLKNLPAPAIPFEKNTVSEFVKNLSFHLTPSQRLAAWEILQDLSHPHPMNRLLEGEVGSGKTVVAGLAMLSCARAGYQSVMLAPTEILALQHYQTLTKLFAHTDFGIALWTRSHRITDKSENRKIRPPTSVYSDLRHPIIIGTHALLQENIQFRNIGLLVIDEQHRFGVKQRQALLRGTYAEQTQNKAEGKLLYEDLTFRIRKCIFSVKERLGGGHKESIYQNAMREEFTTEGLFFEEEKFIDVKYNNKKIGIYKPDFLIDNKVIIELKALPFTGCREEKQLWHYLKGSSYKLALLVNFGQDGLTIKRVVYDTARQSASGPPASAFVPHLLSMTATPIPRTLALAFYGDLDISMLKELPSGRKKIITRLVKPEGRDIAYQFVRQEIKKNRQAYVIVPLVGESSTSPHPSPGLGRVPKAGEVEKKSVATEVVKLQKIFPEFKIGALHGRLKGVEKKQIMEDFKAGKIHILISTTVVEVGVDVPNATLMIIENAERFGLSQLHQLRGRIGRNEQQSYCLLFSETVSDATRERLEAVVASTDGFELSEIDLKLRGGGEILGTRQSGYIPFKIASLSDEKAIELAKKEALSLLEQDPGLKNHPELANRVKVISSNAHLE